MEFTLTPEQAHTKEAARELLHVARTYQPDAPAADLRESIFLALIQLGGSMK